MPYLGDIRVEGRAIPLHRAGVWIHSSSGRPFKLDLEEGIAVSPGDVANPARLPILGLRAIARNDLKLVIDGKRRQVTLRSAGIF